MRNIKLLLLSLSVLVSVPGLSSAANAPEKIQIGETKSRGLWTPAKTKKNEKFPAVILIPGSGPNGPEEMMPAKLTEDGKAHSLFAQISEPFRKQNFNVLALGKPGVEFFSKWDDKGWFDLKALFYDQEIHKKTTWSGLIDNLAAGIDFLKHQPSVDPNRIYILGHSEGTQVASDYAKRDSTIAGYILLGYSGQNIVKIVTWQEVQRPMDHFIKSDIDPKHRGYITKADTINWPSPITLDDQEFVWPWKKDQDQLSYSEIESYLRTTHKTDTFPEKAKASPLYGAVFDRPDFYDETAKIKAPIYIFTGTLDFQTPQSEAIALKAACDKIGKKDCYLHLIPDVGHGFSRPRGPRRHPLADLTVGPINRETTKRLDELARSLMGQAKNKKQL